VAHGIVGLDQFDLFASSEVVDAGWAVDAGDASPEPDELGLVVFFAQGTFAGDFGPVDFFEQPALDF
jgi:hypothetical protein